MQVQQIQKWNLEREKREQSSCSPNAVLPKREYTRKYNKVKDYFGLEGLSKESPCAPKKPGLAGSVFGEDEGDVVVLLVGAEALDFVDDCSQRGLRTDIAVALQGFDEALLTELLVGGIVGFGDAVGVEG